MKKLAFSTILLVALWGCSAVEENTISPEVGQNNERVFNQGASEHIQESNIIIFNRSWYGGAQNSNGFYFAPQRWDTAIKYIDFATNFEIYLTNRPDMAVQNSALLELSGDPISLGLSDTHLYVITENMFRFEPPALYRLNLDGSNPQQLWQFDSENQLDYHFVLMGDELYFTDLIFVTEELETHSLTTAGARRLNRLNITTGQFETIYEGEELGTILGIYKDLILIEKSERLIGEEYSWETDREAWLGQLNGLGGEIIAYSMTTGEFTSLFGIESTNQTDVILSNNKLIFAHNQRRSVEYFNLNTMELGVLFENVPNVSHFELVTDTYLLYSDDAGQMTAIDLETGQVTTVDIGDNYAVAIFGYHEGQLLFNVLTLGPLLPAGEREIIEENRAFVEINQFLSGNFEWNLINQL